MGIKTNCEIRTYPDFDKESSVVKIKNHWSYAGKVFLTIDGKECIVIGHELINAVRKCMN